MFEINLAVNTSLRYFNVLLFALSSLKKWRSRPSGSETTERRSAFTASLCVCMNDCSSPRVGFLPHTIVFTLQQSSKWSLFAMRNDLAG